MNVIGAEVCYYVMVYAPTGMQSDLKLTAKSLMVGRKIKPKSKSFPFANYENESSYVNFIVSRTMIKYSQAYFWIKYAKA